MSRQTLSLLARTEQGRTTLSSPAVGIYSAPPACGEGLVAGSRAGVLRRLGHAVDLVVPEGSGGRVIEVLTKDLSSPVAYGEAVIVLGASGTDEMRDGPGRDLPDTAAAGDDVLSADPLRGAGRYALRAPTAGVFYGRPDPASPAFLAPGSSLEAGQTAGLIEVMKVFSPIVHPGGTIPSPAIVVELLASDGQEVAPGQVLLVLRAP